jgi:hypothetical protein
MLGRQLDGAGMADYKAGLDNGSLTRAGLARAIVESDEFRARHSSLFFDSRPLAR